MASSSPRTRVSSRSTVKTSLRSAFGRPARSCSRRIVICRFLMATAWSKNCRDTSAASRVRDSTAAREASQSANGTACAGEAAIATRPVLRPGSPSPRRPPRSHRPPPHARAHPSHGFDVARTQHDPATDDQLFIVRRRREWTHRLRRPPRRGATVPLRLGERCSRRGRRLFEGQRGWLSDSGMASRASCRAGPGPYPAAGDAALGCAARRHAGGGDQALEHI